MGFGSMVNYLLLYPFISLLLHLTQDTRCNVTTLKELQISGGCNCNNSNYKPLALLCFFAFHKKLLENTFKLLR